MVRGVLLLPALLLALVSTPIRAEDPAPFSLEAWQQAADSKAPEWSRRDLLDQFAATTTINGMTREELRRRLGAPGIAEAIYFPGEGPQGGIDFYRLSAKNEDSFRVDYDAEGKVTGNVIEASPLRLHHLQGCFAGDGVRGCRDFGRRVETFRPPLGAILAPIRKSSIWRESRITP
jgi:hypothetical protein